MALYTRFSNDVEYNANEFNNGTIGVIAKGSSTKGTTHLRPSRADIGTMMVEKGWGYIIQDPADPDSIACSFKETENILVPISPAPAGTTKYVYGYYEIGDATAPTVNQITLVETPAYPTTLANVCDIFIAQVTDAGIQAVDDIRKSYVQVGTDDVFAENINDQQSKVFNGDSQSEIDQELLDRTQNVYGWSSGATIKGETAFVDANSNVIGKVKSVVDEPKSLVTKEYFDTNNQTGVQHINVPPHADNLHFLHFDEDINTSDIIKIEIQGTYTVDAGTGHKGIIIRPNFISSATYPTYAYNVWGANADTSMIYDNSTNTGMGIVMTNTASADNAFISTIIPRANEWYSSGQSMRNICDSVWDTAESTLFGLEFGVQNSGTENWFEMTLSIYSKTGKTYGYQWTNSSTPPATLTNVPRTEVPIAPEFPLSAEDTPGYILTPSLEAK